MALASPRRRTRQFPATAGPFYVAEYQPGDYVRLARNPHYWKRDGAGHPLPYLDSIRIDIQQNHDIELTRFLRGDLTLIDRVEPENFDRIAKEKPGAARSLGASLDSEFLWFNQSPAKSLPDYKRAWFRSTVFRNAVSSAIHRDDIVRIVYRGHAHPAAGPISTANKFWFNASLKPRVADPQGALKALAAEGFAMRDGVLRDREGHAGRVLADHQLREPAARENRFADSERSGEDRDQSEHYFARFRLAARPHGEIVRL